MRADTYCLLDSGEVKKYHYAIKLTSMHPDKKDFTHIGDGTIYSVNGNPYYGDDRLSFFVVAK